MESEAVIEVSRKKHIEFQSLFLSEKLKFFNKERTEQNRGCAWGFALQGNKEHQCHAHI